MDAITHDLEIWLICSTAWPAKNISKSFCLNVWHNIIYGQSSFSQYISYVEAI